MVECIICKTVEDVAKLFSFIAEPIDICGNCFKKHIVVDNFKRDFLNFTKGIGFCSKDHCKDKITGF